MGSARTLAPLPPVAHRRLLRGNLSARRSRRHRSRQAGWIDPGDLSFSAWRFRNRLPQLMLHLVLNVPEGCSSPSAPVSMSRFVNDRPTRSLRFATASALRRQKGVFSKSAGPCRRIVTVLNFPYPSIPFGVSGSGVLPVSTSRRCTQRVSRSSEKRAYLSTSWQYASGQAWISQRLTAERRKSYRSRLARSRRRRAFSLIKPTASF